MGIDVAYTAGGIFLLFLGQVYWLLGLYGQRTIAVGSLYQPTVLQEIQKRPTESEHRNSFHEASRTCLRG